MFLGHSDVNEVLNTGVNINEVPSSVNNTFFVINKGTKIPIL